MRLQHFMKGVCRMRKTLVVQVATFGLFVLATVYAADSPFVGTWKLNPARSEFTGTTITLEPGGAGEMKATAEGQTYTFKMDGKDYPTPFGMTAAWTQVDPATWKTVYKMPNNGPVAATDTLTLSADGATLTSTSRGTMPNGESFENVVVYQRVSGSAGLVGKWKSSKVQLSSPETVEIAPYEGDGLTWKFPALKVTLGVKFDGTDHPVTGPTVPPGMTIALSRIDARSFNLTQKMNGRVIYRGTYSLSVDGKTLTAIFAAEGTQEKSTAVYERQ